MSRTGKKPIAVPESVQVQLKGNNITVKGPKGELSRELHRDIIVEQEEEGRLYVKRPTDKPEHRSLHGLTRTLIANMVTGVTEGYTQSLQLVGVGYRAAMQGDNLVLNMGFAHPVVFEPREKIEIEVPSPTKVVIKGIDKQQVNNLAAVIRRVYPPEPYKGKGIRYENENVRQKAGKAGK